jgi:RyR domain
MASKNMDDHLTIEAMARSLHEAWRAGDWPKAARLDRPFDELAEADRDENRAAARRMVDGLAAIGLRLARRGEAPAAHGVEALIERNIEKLASAEHEAWRNHRAANGWSYAPVRDDTTKRHPSMVAYDDLPETEKEKDRVVIRNYPAASKAAGLEIVQLREAQ